MPSMFFSLGIGRHIFYDIHTIVIVTVIYLRALLADWIDILFAWVISTARSNMTMSLTVQHQQCINAATAIVAAMMALRMSNIQTVGQAEVMTVQVNFIFLIDIDIIISCFNFALHCDELQQEQADRDKR